MVARLWAYRDSSYLEMSPHPYRPAIQIINMPLKQGRIPMYDGTARTILVPVVSYKLQGSPSESRVKQIEWYRDYYTYLTDVSPAGLRYTNKG